MTDGDECKVDMVIERYGLDAAGSADTSIDEELRTRWIGENGHDSTGYRSLTRWFNKRLLKHVYDEQSRSTIGTRLDSEYEALTGDDEIVRQEVLDDLRRSDIDGESVCDDMVSWSTMRYHLKDCLGAEKETPSSDRDWERESLSVIRERTAEKTKKVVRSLASKGKLPDGERAVVGVQLQLSCPECPARVSIEEALEQGYVCDQHRAEPKSPMQSD